MMIPHSKPLLGAEEAEAARQVVESGFVASGPQVSAFEKELSEYFGVKGAVACSSGTAALHLSLIGLSADEKTTVHIPSYVCIALWNAAEYCRTKISVCDVDDKLGNLSAQVVINRGKPGDIVILPHMFGSPGPVHELTSAGFRVIEDCAQSIGTMIDNKLTGTFGNAGIFSFYATKVLCAGAGGAVICDSEEMLETLRDIVDYDHKHKLRLRYNYMMTDLQASLARIQLRRLAEFIQRRKWIAAEYDEAVSSAGFVKIDRSEGDIYFRYILGCNDVPGVISRFKSNGVTAARPVFNPIHRYLALEGYPSTEYIYNHRVSLPCYPALTDAEVEKVCETILIVGTTCKAAR